jgi:hypothetical protein
MDDTGIDSSDTQLSTKVTIEERYHTVLRESGRDGCGKFQMLLAFGVMAGMSSFSWLFYSLSFLELIP